MAAGRYLLTLALACLAAGAARAEDAPPAAGLTPVAAPPLAQYCAAHPCRTERREIRLRAQDGGSFALTTETYPYVDDDGSIVIYPGETFAVSFPYPDDLTKAQYLRTTIAIDSATIVPGTLMFKFAQAEGDARMMLMLRNTTAMALSFEATMHVPARDGLRQARTSMCTLLPGMTNTEAWPHPVALIVLSHLRKVDVAGGTISCS